MRYLFFGTHIYGKVQLIDGYCFMFKIIVNILIKIYFFKLIYRFSIFLNKEYVIVTKII